jgi:hypothetical protein
VCVPRFWQREGFASADKTFSAVYGAGKWWLGGVTGVHTLTFSSVFSILSDEARLSDCRDWVSAEGSAAIGDEEKNPMTESEMTTSDDNDAELRRGGMEVMKAVEGAEKSNGFGE